MITTTTRRTNKTNANKTKIKPSEFQVAWWFSNFQSGDAFLILQFMTTVAPLLKKQIYKKKKKKETMRSNINGGRQRTNGPTNHQATFKQYNNNNNTWITPSGLRTKNLLCFPLPPFTYFIKSPLKVGLDWVVFNGKL